MTQLNRMKDGEAPWPSSRAAWRAVFVLVLLGIISMLDRQIINLMAGPIKSDLGLSDFQFSLLQGVSFAIFYATMGIPLGYAADRFPRRWVIFFGVFVWSLATAASGFAQSYGHLLVARVLIGAGEAALAPCAFSMLTDLFPRDRLGRALSVYSYGSGLGVALSVGLGGLLMTVSGSFASTSIFSGMAPWQIGFVLTGAPGILLAFLIFTVPEPTRRDTKGSKIDTWTDVFRLLSARRRFFTAHFAGFSLLMMIVYGIMNWMPVVLMRNFGWSVGGTGLVLALYSAAISLSALTVNGIVVDRWFARGMKDAHMRFFAAGAVVVFLFGALLPFASNAVLFLIFLAPALWALNLYGVSAAALQIVTPARMRGRVSAVYLMVLNLTGIGLGPMLVAVCTNFVFRDDTKLILSIATTMVILSPIAVVVLRGGFSAMREAVLLAEAGLAGDESSAGSTK